MMEKITKKKFFDILAHAENIQVGNPFINSEYIEKYGWDDGRIESACGAVPQNVLKENPKAVRKCKERHSTYLEFSNGSRLYSNEHGKHDYYYHSVNGNGFLISKQTIWDHWKEMENYKYLIYAI